MAYATCIHKEQHYNKMMFIENSDMYLLELNETLTVLIISKTSTGFKLCIAVPTWIQTLYAVPTWIQTLYAVPTWIQHFTNTSLIRAILPHQQYTY